MIDNGKIFVEQFDENHQIFTYDHDRAIMGMPEKFQACEVIVDLPNSYLESMLKFLNAETFRFIENGKIYSNFDWIETDNTDSIIVGYTFMNINKYFRKIKIKDGQKVLIDKTNNGITIGEND